MPLTDINSMDTTDLWGSLANEYQVESQDTDRSTGGKPNYYYHTNWTKQLGYYKTIPELHRVINAAATWTVGKGYTVGRFKQLFFKLGLITGIGTDTFNTILKNMIIVMKICGDSYAEIIKDKKGNVINLKCLNPGTLRIVYDDKGIITKYEQISRLPNEELTVTSFEPEDIFHLSNNRIADEVHGQSVIDSIEWIIKAKQQLMEDWKLALHRNIKPLRVIEADTDDATEIAKIKTEYKKYVEYAEIIVLPKGTAEFKDHAIPANATLPALPTLNYYDNEFYESVGVPRIIVGGSNEITEATAKILYLAFQQNTEEGQLYIEEQTASQLGFTINLEFPADLRNELLSDKAKDKQNGAFQQNDFTAGRGQ